MRRGVAAVICAVLVAVVAALSFIWWAPAEERVFLPFASSRSCVIAVTDDTDFFQFDTTAPVYTLIDSLGLRVTKTVWVFDHPEHPPSRAGLSLDDPAYREWVAEEGARGHEIALHSATAGHDVRAATIAAFDTLESLTGAPARIVVFHSTNREAFYWGDRRLPSPLLRWVYARRTGGSHFEGDEPSSPFYWVDVSRDLVAYVRGYTTDDINTLAVDPSMPYEDPWTPDAPLWCASSNGRLAGEFERLLAPGNVERLKRKRGVSLVYTHFARGFTEPSQHGGSRVTRAARDVFVRCGRDPEVEFAPAGEVLDRLRAVQYLEDAVRAGKGGPGRPTVRMPPRLLGVLDDISLVPSRLPASFGPAPGSASGGGASAPSRGASSGGDEAVVPLREWLLDTGWDVQAGDMTIFDDARKLGLRERYRMVLRWLWMSIVSPSRGYETGT